jgi:hypothetical protein
MLYVLLLFSHSFAFAFGFIIAALLVQRHSEED